MTREEKISKIYEVIADKTLSFGCNIIRDNGVKDFISSKKRFGEQGVWGTNMGGLDPEPSGNQQGYKIIGHPVMLGDAVKWFGENINEGWSQTDYLVTLVGCFDKPDKSIEEQSDECILYLLSLIDQGAQS